MLGQEPVEERRVAVLERGQADVPLERVVLAPQVLELELDLLVDRQHPVGQEAAQAERVALVVPGRRGPWSAAGCRAAPARPARSRPGGRRRSRRRARAAVASAEDSGGGARAGDGQRPVTTVTQRPDHPVRLVARAGGRCTGSVPGVSNRTVVVRVEPAGIVTSVGRDAVDRLRAGPVALVDRRVADDPLVVDRVVVAEHEPDRDAGRHGHGARRRSASSGCRWPRCRSSSAGGRAHAAATPASASDSPMPPTRARRPGRRERSAPRRQRPSAVRRPGPAADAGRAAGSRRSRRC